jgi:hypothetical protein
MMCSPSCPLSFWLAPPCPLFQQRDKCGLCLRHFQPKSHVVQSGKTSQDFVDLADRGSELDNRCKHRARTRNATFLVEVTGCTAQQQEVQETYRSHSKSTNKRINGQIKLIIKVRRSLSKGRLAKRSAVRTHWAPPRCWWIRRPCSRVQHRKHQSRS